MKEKWDPVSLLRHARHDWLNQLQLIKGNLALDRTDRAKEIIEKVVHEAKNEAKVSNLRMPKMAEFLLTYNWQQNKYRLDYEVIGDEQDLSSFDDAIYDWTKEFISHLDKLVEPDGEPHLMITIQLIQGRSRITYDFAGKIDLDSCKALDSLNPLHNSITIVESYCQENELLYILELGS
ncbi:Spo0B C-terminal domain-containing protein [Pseudalkalibacillus sp. R45]|uniref:Spo0B C-terminal domain-containing protein n=1 Tax=Pseudalkalibacillus sp. R45 TaxID=3457433 RepID=UPI003FCD6851